MESKKIPIVLQLSIIAYIEKGQLIVRSIDVIKSEVIKSEN